MTTTAESASAALDAIDLTGIDQHPALSATLAVPAAGGATDQQDDTASATVVGNSLVSFSAYVSAQHKDDLNNSLALAQLSGVKAGHVPTSDPIGYYTYVTTLLQQIGYTAQAIDFGNYQTKTATVEIDQVVLEILGAIIAPAELGIVEAAVNALKGSADDSGAPWAIYSSSSTSNNAGTFSVGLANETNGSVALQLGAFAFTGTADTTKFLWMTYSSTSVSIQDGSTSLSLNDAIYSKVRKEVQKKLGAHAKNYIANLPDL